MNVFFRELRAHRIGLFFWSLGMIFLVGSGVAKFYGYSSSGTSITALLDQFPKSLQVLFGLNGFDLTKPSGAFGMLFMYIVLMAVIHAVLLGADLIAKEERDKTAEFLYAKPVSRSSVITSKLLAGALNLVTLNLITLVSSLYVVDAFSKTSAANGTILLLMTALFILQALFFLIGAGIAAVTRRPKSAASISSAILLAAFILSFVINLNDNLDILKYLSPFKYFEARTIIAAGNLDIVYIIISLALMVGLLILTYGSYRQRDLET